MVSGSFLFFSAIRGKIYFLKGLEGWGRMEKKREEQSNCKIVFFFFHLFD